MNPNVAHYPLVKYAGNVPIPARCPKCYGGTQLFCLTCAAEGRHPMPITEVEQ